MVRVRIEKWQRNYVLAKSVNGQFHPTDHLVLSPKDLKDLTHLLINLRRKNESRRKNQSTNG